MTKTKVKSGPSKLKESPNKRNTPSSNEPSSPISPKGVDKSSPRALTLKQSKNNSNKNDEKLGPKTKPNVDSTALAKTGPLDNIEEKTLPKTPKLELKDGSEKTPLPDTPSSTVRRSGRAPVLSSKFKDMEVDLFTVRKRPSASIATSETVHSESETEHEPPKKRGRKPIQIASSKTPQETSPQAVIVKEIVNEEPIVTLVSIKENITSTTDGTSKADDGATQNSVTVEKEPEDQKLNLEPPSVAVEESVVANETSDQPIPVEIEEVTITEKDSETVAIVETTSPAIKEGGGGIEASKPETSRSTATVSVITLDSHISSSSSSTNVKNPPTMSVYEQDGSSYLNMTIEPTNIGTIMKDAQTKSTKWHGRVLKSEQALSSNMIVKTTLIQPTSSTTVSSLSKESSVTSSSDMYSLITKSLVNKETEPAPQKSSIHGIIQAAQPHQKIVIVRQMAHKPPEITTLASASQINVKSSIAPTVVRVPQDLPSKKGSTTIVHVQKGPLMSALIPNMDLKTVVRAIAGGSLAPAPKTASELLLKRLQQRITVHEATSENAVQQASTGGTSEEPEESIESRDPDHVYSMTGHESANENSATGNKDTEEEKTVTITLDSSTGEVIGEHELADTSTIDTTEGSAVLTELKNMDMSPAISDQSPDKSRKATEQTVEKIKIVDNGIEYDMRVVSEEEVAEEVVDNSEDMLQKEIKVETADGVDITPDLLLKQEPDDEDSNLADGKQTSSTQTVYSPQVTTASAPAAPAGEPLHTLTSVVDEDGQKKQIYYVSVIPNYNVMKKNKQTTCQNETNWVLNDNGLYCCGKCNYKTDRKANFYKHRRLHTGSKPHVCGVCQYKAGTSSNLKRHMGIHKDIREHKCDICGLSFRQKIHLERHVKYKHEEKRVQCPMCDYVCANEQPDLKMHMKRKHSSGSSWEMVNCPQCNIEVNSRKDLKQHMKFHKNGPELKLFCKECSFVTDCQSRLKRHVAIHSKLKPFQCGICSYRAAQKEHVLRHLRTQHKIELKKDNKRPWRRHKNVETEDGSKERADFSSGDKIFACNHCVMRFAKLINLYKHLHTQHADIMPAETDGNYFCVVCEYSTSSKKNLLVHMRRHNLIDQTPPTHVYSCVLCRYINPKRRNLFQHMKKKHNINIIGQLEGEGDDDASQDNENGELIKTVLMTNMNEGDEAAETKGTGQESVSHIIKLENLENNPSTGENDDVHNLVIDTREESNVTDVIHTVHTTHTVEALEGLQALAEQAGLIDNIIEEQVPTSDDQQIVLEHQITNSETVTTEDGQQFQQIFDAGETESTGGQVSGGLELTEEQLSSLRSGDMVEMDGELYLVELTQDATNPNKQVLSFVPVNQSS